MNIQQIQSKSKRVLLAFFTVISLGFAGTVLAATYTVTNAGDATIATSTCNGVDDCTLRQAIMAANAHTGFDVIQFNINNHDPGPFSIKVNSTLGPLPAIVDQVNIDGFTQAGDGIHAIEISGENFATAALVTSPSATSSGYPSGLLLVGRDRAKGATAADGACLDNSTSSGCKLKQNTSINLGSVTNPIYGTNADNSVIRGLAINKFPRQGIYLYDVDHTTIIGNYLGLDTTGNKAGYQNGRNTTGNTYAIRIQGSNYTYVGTTAADYGNNTIAGLNRNVIGSSGKGYIMFSYLNDDINDYSQCNPTTCIHPEIGDSNNVIQGNYMGTNAGGTCIIGGISESIPSFSSILCTGPDNNPTRPIASSLREAIVDSPFRPNEVINNNVIGGLVPGEGNIMDSTQARSVDINGTDWKFLGNIFGRDKTGQVDLIASTRNQTFQINITDGCLIQGNIFAAGQFLSSVTAAVNITAGIGNINGHNVFLPNNTHTTFINNQIVDNYHTGLSILSVDNGKFGFDIVNGSVVPMPNIIAHNKLIGVAIQQLDLTAAGIGVGPAPHAALLYNSIYDNNTVLTNTGVLGMGIDILRTPTTTGSLTPGDGPNLNDPLDVDTGSNSQQNFPVLDAQRSFLNPALVKVVGVFNSAPNADYILQFFSSTAATCIPVKNQSPLVFSDPSPSCTAFPLSPFLAGQGQVFIGEAVIHTDANGNASYSIPAKVGIPVGSIITGTATSLQMINGIVTPIDTSEFSQAVDVDKKGSITAYQNANGAAGGDASSDSLDIVVNDDSNN